MDNDTARALVNKEMMGMGADISPTDIRTVKHEDVATAGLPLIKGGVEYLASDIENQHYVGICTDISTVQFWQKVIGKKFSPDFGYLCQKKFYDLGWWEGSSLFSALKVAKNIGFLPAHLWTHTTENDRYLPYSQYIAKLQAIPDTEIERLKELCVDKILGYASVNVNDPQAIAKAISDSPNQAGILCRYPCSKSWWTDKWGNVTWDEDAISPLRNQPPYTSGHAIIMSKFDYTNENLQTLPNTWGTDYCRDGSVDIIWDSYPPTEAWTILETAPVIPPHVFYKVLRYGMNDPEVGFVQKVLGGLVVDNKFGNKTLQAVVAFQEKNHLLADGIVGKNTNAQLNLAFGH